MFFGCTGPQAFKYLEASEEDAVMHWSRIILVSRQEVQGQEVPVAEPRPPPFRLNPSRSCTWTFKNI